LNNSPKMKIQIKPEEVKNILVIRKHNQIGDVMVSVPMYYALKKKYPDSRITLLASPTNYPIPFFDINPYLDEVVSFEKSSLKNQIDILKYLKSKKFQIGIVPSTIRLSVTSHIVNFLSGIKYRIGVNSIDNKKNPARFMLNIKKDFYWNNNKTHQLIRNLEIIEQIGCKINLSEALSIKFQFNGEEKETIKTLNNYFGERKIIIGLHPGAGKKENIWKTKNFIELIKCLKEKLNCNFLITIGSTDEEIYNELIPAINKEKIKYFVCKNLPIKQLASFINQCDLFISNDTGVMHIAGWTDVKLISLFGRTIGFEWAPLGKNKFFIQSKSEEIDDIEIEDVFKLAIKILQR